MFLKIFIACLTVKHAFKGKWGLSVDHHAYKTEKKGQM